MKEGVRFAKHHLKNGVRPKNIRSELRAGGWSEEFIQDVMETAHEESQVHDKDHFYQPVIVWMVIIAVLAFILLTL